MGRSAFVFLFGTRELLTIFRGSDTEPGEVIAPKLTFFGLLAHREKIIIVVIVIKVVNYCAIIWIDGLWRA